MFFLPNGGLWSQEQRADAIVAIVNDEVITYGEVYNKVKEGLSSIEKSGMSQRLQEAKKQMIFNSVLRQLVDEKLTLQEAKRYNIKISEETIRQQLKKELAQEGSKPINMGEVDLTDLVRKQLTFQELFQKKSSYSKEEKRRAAIDTWVTPKELQGYYTKNISQFTREGKIKTRIITLFYAKSGGREQCLAKAEALVKELHKGADFSEMARLYSQDPYASKELVPGGPKEGGAWPRVERAGKLVWDFFGKGEALFEEVEDIAFSMKEGEISDPIAVDNQEYCQIVKVEMIKKGGVVPFVEVQDAIQQKLRYEKIISALARMRDRLRQRAFIWPSNLFKEGDKEE